MAQLLNYLKVVPKLLNYNFTEVHNPKLLVAVGCGVGTVFAGYITLHTLLLDKYKNVLQMYRNGFATPITPEITLKVQEVVSDMKLSDKHQGYLQPFFTVFADPAHMGSIKLRGGAYIGIPGNFRYKSTADIEREEIMLHGKPISWNSEAGELYQDSLILSDNAQKFAIAREMSHLDTHYVHNYALVSCSAIYVQYLAASYLNSKTHGHLRPKSYRYTLYALVGVFTCGLWSFVTDALTHYYENTADKTASALGIDYARGAVEFYSKVARRNIASRELMGADGEKVFTKYGNSNSDILRQKHVSVSQRKERAEKRVQKMLGIDESNIEYV